MKPERGGCIEIEVNVVNLMKPPKEGNLVREDMPAIEGVIEENAPQQNFQPERNSDILEEAPLLYYGQLAQASDHGQFRQLHSRRSEAGHGKVPGCMSKF
jgi:hypothetical protein